MSRIINKITTTNIKLLISFVKECRINQSYKTVKLNMIKETPKSVRKFGVGILLKIPTPSK